VGESKAERQKWIDRAATEREVARRASRGSDDVSQEIRRQLLAHGQRGADALRDLLDAGQPVRLIVEPDGCGGARFTVKTVQEVSQTRGGVYVHGVVKSEEDVSESLLRVLEKGDWRIDQYWKP
jgi:hypothetical protein